MAQEAQENVKKIASEESLEKALPNVPLAPIYKLISDNEAIIANEAYCVLTNEGKQVCTRETVNKIMDDPPFGKIVLFFLDRELLLHYNGESIRLDLKNAEMLRYFFLLTNQEQPADRQQFKEIFNTTKTDEVNIDAYRQRVSRLNRKLRDAGIDDRIIESKNVNNETVYYYNNLIPFVIIHRTDDSFALDPIEIE